RLPAPGVPPVRDRVGPLRRGVLVALCGVAARAAPRPEPGRPNAVPPVPQGDALGCRAPRGADISRLEGAAQRARPTGGDRSGRDSRVVPGAEGLTGATAHALVHGPPRAGGGGRAGEPCDRGPGRPACLVQSPTL